MTFQHVLPLGPCAYLGHINTAPTCTISLKLVLVFASNPLLLPLLRRLRNLISSSAHSGVVQRHVEFWTLGSSSSNNEKSIRLKSY